MSYPDERQQLIHLAIIMLFIVNLIEVGLNLTYLRHGTLSFSMEHAHVWRDSYIFSTIYLF